MLVMRGGLLLWGVASLFASLGGSELTARDYEEIGVEAARRREGGVNVDEEVAEVGRRRLFMDTHMTDTNRTAILLSGQLRSSNLTWAGGQIRRNRESVMFGSNDPPTPAACIIDFLFKSLDRQGGGFDVFMFLTAKHDAKRADWNGEPLFFEPAPGDTTACRVFSDHALFDGSRGHRFFCLVEPEVRPSLPRSTRRSLATLNAAALASLPSPLPRPRPLPIPRPRCSS